MAILAAEVEVMGPLYASTRRPSWGDHLHFPGSSAEDVWHSAHVRPDHGPTYRFVAPLWEWEGGQAAWHFVTLPEEASDEIRAITEGTQRRGFGSVRVEVTVAPATWRTSVFPDKASGCYVLPVKKDVRQRAGLEAGDDVTVALTVTDPLR